MDISQNIIVGSMRGLKSMPGWVDIKCDRSSVLGNPFDLVKESDRDSVAHAHKQFLNQVRLNDNVSLSIWKEQKVASAYRHPGCKTIRNELSRIEGLLRQGYKIRLLCWCSPKRCHADNIRDYLIWRCRQ